MATSTTTSATVESSKKKRQEEIEIETNDKEVADVSRTTENTEENASSPKTDAKKNKRVKRSKKTHVETPVDPPEHSSSESNQQQSLPEIRADSQNISKELEQKNTKIVTKKRATVQINEVKRLGKSLYDMCWHETVPAKKEFLIHLLQEVCSINWPETSDDKH